MQNQPNPLSDAQQQQVCQRTNHFILLAARLYNNNFPSITVLFDLTGRSAGMFRVKGKQKSIRYNPYIFAKYYQDNLYNTVPHEVAHYIAYQLYAHRVAPHGPQWQQIMHDFNRSPKVYCEYDITGIPQKRYQYIDYHCHCGTQKLTKIRHNRILKGSRYFCKKCHQPLIQMTR